MIDFRQCDRFSNITSFPKFEKQEQFMLFSVIVKDEWLLLQKEGLDAEKNDLFWSLLGVICVIAEFGAWCFFVVKSYENVSYEEFLTQQEGRQNEDPSLPSKSRKITHQPSALSSTNVKPICFTR